MNRHPIVALLALSFAPWAATTGQTAFEGVATFKNTVGGRSVETTYYSKGMKVRQEMVLGGQSAVTITDYGNARSITLMPSQKKYMVMDFKAMAEAVKPLAKDKVPEKPAELPHITATGKRETVAGRSCEHYLMETGNGQLDMCAAKGIGNFNAFAGAALSGGKPASDNPQYREILKAARDGFFPLKTTMTDKTGKVVFESVAVSIEPKSLAADLFEPPAGFTEFKMPTIPGLPKRP